MTLSLSDVRPSTARSAVVLQWENKQGESKSLRFDAVTSVEAEDKVDITEHPVEEGADVTDHARTNLVRLTLEAVISQSPNPTNDASAKQVNGAQNVFAAMREEQKLKKISLDIPTPPLQLSESGLIQGGLSALKRSILGAPKATVRSATTSVVNSRSITIVTGNATSRPRDIYQQLLDIKDEHTLLHIVTLYREYSDMMIERMAVPRATADGSNLKFSIDFKEIRTVSSLSVKAPKPVEPRAAQPVKAGSKNSKPDPNPAPKVGLAKQFLNYLSSHGL